MTLQIFAALGGPANALQTFLVFANIFLFASCKFCFLAVGLFCLSVYWKNKNTIYCFDFYS